MSTSRSTWSFANFLMFLIGCIGIGLFFFGQEVRDWWRLHNDAPQQEIEAQSQPRPAPPSEDSSTGTPQRQSKARRPVLPEFYGFYANDGGQLFDFSKTKAIHEFSPNVTFLVFDKMVGLLTASDGVQVERYTAIQYENEESAIFDRVGLLKKPVSGQTEMIEFVPNTPLRPGLYKFGGAIKGLFRVRQNGISSKPLASSLRYEVNDRQVVFSFDVASGNAPLSYVVYINGQPLSQFMDRYSCGYFINPLTAFYKGDVSTTMYEVGKPELKRDQAGDLKCTFSLGMHPNCLLKSFTWPPDVSYPILMRVEVEDSSRPPRKETVEVAISPGRSLFESAQSSRVSGTHVWIEIDKKPYTPIQGLSGKWKLTSKYLDPKTYSLMPIENDIIIEQKGSRLSATWQGQDIQKIDGELKGFVIEFKMYIPGKEKEGAMFFGTVEKATKASGQWGRAGGGGNKWTLERIEE